jgi:hypothetical protein
MLSAPQRTERAQRRTQKKNFSVLGVLGALGGEKKKAEPRSTQRAQKK